MTTNRNGLTTRVLVTAVHSALIAMALAPAAYAADATPQDPAVAQLTQPTSKVEVGAGYVSQDSFKFGEYNGLFNKGLYGIFNLDVRGGGAYDSGDPTRWRITGTDLGLETRNATAEIGQQGRFRINFGYDELRRTRNDTYQTPYLDAGSNNLTLPGSWIAPKVPQVNANNVNFRSLDPTAGTGPTYNAAGVLTPPTAAQLNTLSAIRAADLPAFHNVDLSTKRTKYDGAFSYSFDPQWDIQASFRHEHKEGLKWIGAVSSQVSEFSAILPDLISQDTDQANISLNYKGQKGFVQVAYYGSFFRNDVQSMTWQDVNDPTKSATLSSPPSNDFHQIMATGAYKFSPTTKLVANVSYGRNTQNDAFLGPATAANGQLAFGLPATSLNGLVVSKALNAKLTAMPLKGLNLSANYKYDDRDNRTPVNLYLFQDANEAKSGVSPFAGLNGLPANIGSNTNIYNNRAYSKQINQLNLQADYALTKGQWLQAGYDWQKIDRNCNGAWIDCADAATTKEDTLRAEWRANVMEAVSGRLGYAYSQRRVSNYNENAFLALVPMANVVPAGGATISAYQYLLQTGLTGFGPVAGVPTTPLTGNAAIFSPNNNILPQALYGSRNNINELSGMRRYFLADRNRDKLRATIDWQPNEKFSLQGALEFNKDDYTNSVYGLQDAKSWALNLDGSYSVTENFVASVFYTYEDQRSTSAGDAYGSNATTAFVGQAGNTIVSDGCFSTVLDRNRSGKIDPCLNWSKDTHDKVDTVGIAFRQKNLMSGMLDLTGDLTFARARTNIGVAGGSYLNNFLALAAPAPALAAGVPAVFFIPASDLPTVTNTTITLRLNGNYTLNKASAVRVLYLYQHLKSTDYAYEGMQYGTGTNYLPTNEQPFHYNVHVIGVSYIYRWQ